MLGAIIGDVVGSRFEWNNHKSKDFVFLNSQCKPTDDSIMTLAVAKALLSFDGDYDKLSRLAEKSMTEMAMAYPNAGYGGRFWDWLNSESKKPYNSFGNGSAMRISPVAYYAHSEDELKKLCYAVTAISHNHPDGLLGAEAVAMAIYLAKNGKNAEEIKNIINDTYYALGFTLDDIREGYAFDVSCKGSVPVALEAFFESENFEDAVRNAVSVGGDSDTIAAITGAVAEAHFGIPEKIQNQILRFLDEKQIAILKEFDKLCHKDV